MNGFRLAPGNAPAVTFSLAALLQVALVTPSHAAITTTGSVSADPNMTTSATDLTIGVSTPGTMTVTGGSDVLSNRGTLAGNSGSSAAVEITGAGSTWVNSADLRVGNAGNATLNILDGGLVSNTSASIGRPAPGSSATVTVDNATWTNTAALSVGSVSTGTLNIDNGGSVTSVGTSSVGATGTVNIANGGSWTTSGSYRISGVVEVTGGGDFIASGGSATVGYAASSTVAVTGTGSTFNPTAGLTVGAAAAGSLAIEAGGLVLAPGLTIGNVSAVSGNVTIDGATSQLTSTGTVTVGSAGGGIGTLTLTNGGTLATSQNLNIGPAGTVNLNGGVLDMGDKTITPATGATFNFTAGTLQNVASFSGNLLQQGGKLAAGAATGVTTDSTIITGNYTLGSAGTLEVDIAGISTYDVYTIGDVALDGDLALLQGFFDVNLLGSFVPEEGQTFNVLTADVINASGLSISSGFDYEVVAAAGGRQALQLTYVPEPASLALLAVAVGLIAWRRPNAS